MEPRAALITGGVRGIGRAVGLALAKKGWSVAATYRKSADDAATFESAVTEAGGRALAIRADVSDPNACEEVVAAVERELGRIDALVHAAGPYHRVNLLDETPDGWREMFDNNLHPVFYLSRLAARGMRERRFGRIVTFAMANADQGVGQPHVTAHYIAKAGVLILTRTLAKLLAPHGITVNAVSPGFVASGSAPEEELAKMVKNIPAGYVGTLDDATNAVLWLLGDEARYVNGGNLHLSGAWGV